jgi:hypothetical protein
MTDGRLADEFICSAHESQCPNNAAIRCPVCPLIAFGIAVRVRESGRYDNSPAIHRWDRGPF